MFEFANTRITIQRGTESDEYGDTSDVGVPLYTDVPACLTEQTSKSFDPATQTPRTVRDITCVLPSWQDVLTTDTIVDQATGYTYMIESVTMQPSIGWPSDIVLQLTRITASSV